MTHFNPLPVGFESMIEVENSVQKFIFWRKKDKQKKIYEFMNKRKCQIESCGFMNEKAE